MVVFRSACERVSHGPGEKASASVALGDTGLPVALPKGLTVRQAAEQWGVSKSTAARWMTSGTVPV